MRPRVGQRPAGRAAPRDGAELAAVLPREILEFERDSRRRGRPRSGRGGRSAIGAPGRSSSPVRTMVMLASRSVPAACMRAQRRDDHDEPAFVVADAGAGGAVALRGRSAGTGCRARTPCRDGRSGGRCGRGPDGWRRDGRRGRSRAMSTQRTSKPSGSSSARIIAPTAATPARFSVPLLTVHQPLEQRDVRSASRSTAAAMRRSSGVSWAAAGAARARSRRGEGSESHGVPARAAVMARTRSSLAR